MAAPPPVIAPRYKSFAELFSDPDKDPCRGNYRQLMGRFAATNAQVSAARLMDQCVGNVGIIPQAFLCTRHYKIYCIHNLSRFLPALDGSPSPWDDGIFGFVGDLTANHCPSVRLPPEVLTPVEIRAFTEEYMRRHLEELHDPYGLFPSPPVDHAEATQVSVRGLIYLPLRYAPLLLQGKGYPPREVWELLVPLLFDNNLQDDCRPLIDWLRAATTSRGDDPDTRAPLPPPI
jgi:hypothetical protein